jgi:photosystem II stability/assembly factor-like uncharacterized protein
MAAQNNPVTGAIQAIAVDPHNANTVYVGAVNGGVWKTTQAGGSSPAWTPLTDHYPSLAIGALAFNPSGTALYGGTGNFTNGDTGRGDHGMGLLKTTNGGTSWTVLGEDRFKNLSIRAVAAEDPSAGQEVVLVAAVDPSGHGPADEGGLFRSTNGGTSWTRLSGSPYSGTNNPTTHLPPGSATAVVADPGHAGAFYAAVAGNGSFDEGIYYSTDHGATWTLRSPLPAQGAVQQTQRIVLSVSPAGSSPVYAAFIVGGHVNAVYRSGDQGQTWQPITNLPDLNPGGQAVNNLSLLADRTDSNVFYMGGDYVELTNPATNKEASFGTIYRAAASSNIWTQLVGSGAHDSAPHADSRQMVFDGNDILETDDGGIYRLTGLSVPSATRWISLNGNLSTAEVQSVAYDALNNVLFAGSQDNGSAEQTAAGNPSWQASAEEGDGNGQAADNLDGSATETFRYSMDNNFHQFYRRGFHRGDAQPAETVRIALAKPVAGAAMYSGLNEADQTVFSGSLSKRIPYTLDAVDSSRLLLGYYGLYESFNRGDTIRELDSSKFGGISTPVSAVAYGGMENGQRQPNVLYVARANRIFARQPDGSVLEFNTHGLVIRSIVLDPDNWKTAYAIDQRSVYRTTDGGTTWDPLTGSLGELDAEPFQSVELAKTSSGAKVLLVGGLGGIYRSLNPGANPSWHLFGIGLPNVLVTDVHFIPNSHLLVAGTFGRGVWSMANADAALTADDPVLLAVADAGTNVTVSRDADNPSLVRVVVGTGPSSLTGAWPLAGVGSITVQSAGGSTITLD